MSNSKSATQSGSIAKNAGEFLIGNGLRVARLGFGAMRITGKGIWANPRIVMRRSGFYGGLSNWESILSIQQIPTDQASVKIIAEALHPYPAGLVMPQRPVSRGRVPIDAPISPLSS
jgi:pyridoxine 4-dehydrogenase